MNNSTKLETKVELSRILFDVFVNQHRNAILEGGQTALQEDCCILPAHFGHARRRSEETRRHAGIIISSHRAGALPQVADKNQSSRIAASGKKISLKEESVLIRY